MSLPHLGHTRTQWNVGQGGFHTGEVLDAAPAADSIFRYVYDCGSISAQPALEQCLAAYVESLGRRKKVDAVFLSHIDDDHVNGLPDLFGKHGVSAAKIFLPLLTPVERLLTLARPGVRINEFLIQLASDPTATLRGISDAEIVTVTADGQSSDSGDGARLQLLSEENDDGGYAEVIGREGVWVPVRDGTVSMGDSAVVRVTTRDRGDAWLLGFYIERDSLSLANDFLIELSQGLEKDPDAIQSEDPAFLRHLLTDPASLKVLRAAYEAAKVDPNQGSLILLSGPANDDEPELVRFGRVHGYSSGTWLLTGDAKLKTAAQVDDLAAHFGDRLQRTKVISLPHHGSRNNFHESLVAIGDEPLALAFASTGTKYENWAHPAASVVRHVASSGAVPWTVTESERTRITGRL